jgi:hypothetical protein
LPRTCFAATGSDAGLLREGWFGCCARSDDKASELMHTASTKILLLNMEVSFNVMGDEIVLLVVREATASVYVSKDVRWIEPSCQTLILCDDSRKR